AARVRQTTGTGKQVLRTAASREAGTHRVGADLPSLCLVCPRLLAEISVRPVLPETHVDRLRRVHHVRDAEDGLVAKRVLGDVMSSLEVAIGVMFWFCVGGVAYTYVGYPAVVWAF